MHHPPRRPGSRKRRTEKPGGRGLRTRVDSEEKGPERTCVVSGLKGSPETMLRLRFPARARSCPTFAEPPGRGVWTRLSCAVVRQAAAKQAFSRGFRASVRAGADLADEVDGLEQDALRFLSWSTRQGWSPTRWRQGRGGDPCCRLEGQFGRADTGVRRGARRREQAAKAARRRPGRYGRIRGQ